MRLFFVLCIFALSNFPLSSTVQAQEDTTSDVPQKSIMDYLGGAGRYILGDSVGDYERPYIKDGKSPHNNQWDLDTWHPEFWVNDKGSVEAVTNSLYESGVLVEQYEDKVPVLEVGKPFLNLSPIDQRRVIKFVDYAYKITSSEESGVFYVVTDQSRGKRLLGIYSIHGLQFQ